MRDTVSGGLIVGPAAGLALAGVGEVVLPDISDEIEALGPTGVLGDSIAELGGFEPGEVGEILPPPPSGVIPGAKWMIVAKIFLDTGTEYVSEERVHHPHYIYEGKVQRWGSVDRSVPAPSGLPHTSDARVRVIDTDRYLRNLLAHQTPRRRFMELRFVQEGGAESARSPFFVGEILDFEFSAGACDISLRDRAFAWIDEEIPEIINRTNFPELPDDNAQAFFPIIFGSLRSRSVGPQGVVSLPHIGWSDDTGDRYAVACHRVYHVAAVYRKSNEGWVVVSPSEYNVAFELRTIDGLGYDLTFLDFTVEQPQGTEIRIDVDGLPFRPSWNGYPPAGFDAAQNPDVLPGPLRNPIDLFISLTSLVLRRAGREVVFDAGAIMWIREKFEHFALTGGVGPYYCDGAITSALTCRELLSRFLACFQLDMFQTRDGKISLRFTDNSDSLRPVFTEGRHILRNSFRERLANPTANRTVYRFEYNHASNQWATQGLLDNLDSQLVLGDFDDDGVRQPKVESDIFDMWFVRDPRTARDVTFRRMNYLAVGSYRQEFKLPAPEVIEDLELGRLMGFTHHDGLGLSGYQNREVKITGMTIDCDRFEVTVRSILRRPQVITLPLGGGFFEATSVLNAPEARLGDVVLGAVL